jgi:hypothetical protein
MYTCKWFIFCESIFKDSLKNTPVIVSPIFGITASKFPVLHPRFAFSVALAAEGASKKRKVLPEVRFIREVDGKDEILLSVESHLKEAGCSVDMSLSKAFEKGIRLFGPGRINFRIDIKEKGRKWYTAARQYLDVEKMEAKNGKANM